MAELVAVEFRDDRCPTFESIVRPILPNVAGCAWAFEGSTPFTALGPAAIPFPEDEDLVRLFDPAPPGSEHPPGETGWLRPDGITRLLPFVLSDWLEVYAVASPAFPRARVRNQPAANEVAAMPGIKLYMECVDGAFWRAWSPLAGVMAALRADGRARSIRWEQRL